MAQATRRPAREDLIQELNTLINLDYDAIKAYDAAIDRLENVSHRAHLQAFKQDHANHTQNLAAVVGEQGGEPAGQSDAHAVLPQGKVVINNIVGDLGVLKAMSSNEQVISDVYERARHTLANHPDIVRVLDENLRDERKHKDWLEQVLKAQEKRSR